MADIPQILQNDGTQLINDIRANIKGLNILIIGPPGSGKTYLSSLFESESHKIIHTDDYISYGYLDSVDHILNALKLEKKNTIIEGVQGYRLLRSGLLSGYTPDVIIELQISDYTIKKIEKIRGKNYSSFIKSNQSILNEYLSMVTKKPYWIKFKNDYL